MRTKTKEASLSTLIHDLDGVFSRFIRLRDTHNGRIKCFICGTSMSFQEAQCGHFIDRDQIPTRFDERNCHSVCQECNCFDPEHANKYYKWMVNKYGLREVIALEYKARGLQKYMRWEIEDLIEHYNRENAILKKRN